MKSTRMLGSALVIATLVFPVAWASTDVRAAAPDLGQLKEQLKAGIEKGQVQAGLDHVNANRARLGLGPVTIVHAPPPVGGMSQPGVAGYGILPAGQVGTASDSSNKQFMPYSSGYSGGWYWVSMNKWIEPDGGNGSSSCRGYNGYTDARGYHGPSWFANLCGPGASEALISNWNNNPSTYNGYYYYGYIASQGLRWLGYMLTVANEEMANTTCPEDTWPGYQYTGWGTCDAAQRVAINHEIGVNYYHTDWCASSSSNPNCSNPSYGDWTSDVNVDVAGGGVPLVAEVMTCDTSNSQCLAGWPYRADHFQSISQYDPSEHLDKYAETGNAYDACQNGYAPGAWTGTWRDPYTGANFNDNTGWDYVSNQFHWQRSRSLTW